MHHFCDIYITSASPLIHPGIPEYYAFNVMSSGNESDLGKDWIVEDLEWREETAMAICFPESSGTPTYSIYL